MSESVVPHRHVWPCAEEWQLFETTAHCTFGCERTKDADGQISFFYPAVAATSTNKVMPELLEKYEVITEEGDGRIHVYCCDVAHDPQAVEILHTYSMDVLHLMEMLQDHERDVHS